MAALPGAGDAAFGRDERTRLKGAGVFPHRPGAGTGAQNPFSLREKTVFPNVKRGARVSPWTREYGRTCKECVRGCKFVMFHASSISVRRKCRGWRRGEENRKASASIPAAAPWFLDAGALAKSGQRQRKEKNRPCDKHPVPLYRVLQATASLRLDYS